MAKKKKVRKKKQPTGKATSGKLETKLFGYWKKQAWGEFITLYQRHWEQAKQTQAANLWDPAIYNLLLETTFAEQDFSLLQKLHAELSSAPEISAQNQKCLQVIAVFLEVYQARAYPALTHNLPADPPGPFAELSAQLQEMLTPNTSSLPDYIHKRLKRARKGEKHLSQAAKAWEQFHALRMQGFHPQSVKPLSQFKKTIADMHAALRSNQGISSPVLQDMQILAELMQLMYSRSGIYRFPDYVLNLLQREGFQANRHPAVHSMLQAILCLGKGLYGTQWENAMRYTLRNLDPELGPKLPEHLQLQLQALGQLKKRPQREGPLLKQMLDLQVWDTRERMLLLMALLQQLKEMNQDILDDLFYSIGGAFNEMQVASVVHAFLQMACNALGSIYNQFSTLGLKDSSFLTQAADQWRDVVAQFPFFNSVQDLDRLIATLRDSSAPDAVLLFPLLKRAEIEPPTSRTPLQISKEIQNRIPLEVNSDDLHQVIPYLSPQSELQTILQTWKKCLSQEKYQELVRIFLHNVLQNSCMFMEQDFNPSEQCLLEWTNIPREVMQELLQDVDQDFELYGLMRLSAYAQNNGLPMPANAKEAALFLDYLPPPQTLNALLKWMLTWPRTVYRNTFLAALIRHHADYLTRNQGWADLSLVIADERLKKLAEMVWELWRELDLFQSLKHSRDFSEAQAELRPMLPKNQKTQKAKTGPKKQKKPPLIKILEEASQDSKNKNRKK